MEAKRVGKRGAKGWYNGWIWWDIKRGEKGFMVAKRVGKGGATGWV